MRNAKLNISLMASFLAGLATIASGDATEWEACGLNLREYELWQAATVEDVQFCISQGVPLDTHLPEFPSDSPLSKAIRFSDLSIARSLLEAGADVNYRWGRGTSALHIAISSTQVEMLVAAGADVNSRDLSGQSPLHFVKNADVAIALINAGSEIEARDLKGFTPLHQATEPGIIQVFLSAGASIDARSLNGQTPLHRAFFGDSVEVVRLLLEAGADINSMDVDGATPLHWAAARGTASQISLLIENGADVNSRNSRGITPLHWATARGLSEQMEVLLNAGADVNARDNQGRTPLNWAASEGLHEQMSLLLDAGADINTSDYQRATPLHSSVTARDRVGIMLLIEAGADATAENADGKTPFDLANEKISLKGTDVYWTLNDARFNQRVIQSAPVTRESFANSNIGPPLTSTELDTFRNAVYACWSGGALSSAALRVTVVVSAEMTEDGKPIGTSLRLLAATGGEGQAVTQAYEAARRAILRCGISGYDLPKEKYAQWREIEMTFNASAIAR